MRRRFAAAAHVRRAETRNTFVSRPRLEQGPVAKPATEDDEEDEWEDVTPVQDSDRLSELLRKQSYPGMAAAHSLMRTCFFCEYLFGAVLPLSSPTFSCETSICRLSFQR